MFHINYETAKAEVARRHERLVDAQRSGIAYEPPLKRPGFFAAVASRLRRKPASTATPVTPVTAQGDPCLTC